MEKDKSCKTPRWRMLKGQLNNLSAQEFADAFSQTEDAILIDVRTADEFDFGHIPNAINMNYFSEDLIDKIQSLEKDKNYFIYCRSGRRSIRVCTWMRNGGFEKDKIFNLDKGFPDWIEKFPERIKRP